MEQDGAAPRLVEGAKENPRARWSKTAPTRLTLFRHQFVNSRLEERPAAGWLAHSFATCAIGPGSLAAKAKAASTPWRSGMLSMLDEGACRGRARQG